MNHTAEPWHFFDGEIFCASGDMVCTFERSSFNVEHNEVDARRIVACVNALEGMPLEDLEKAGNSLMIDAAALGGELTTQRDELLCLLKRHLADNPDGSGSFCTCSLCQATRTAIARIEADK
jgi:hypothetical protein